MDTLNVIMLVTTTVGIGFYAGFSYGLHWSMRELKRKLAASRA